MRIERATTEPNGPARVAEAWREAFLLRGERPETFYCDSCGVEVIQVLVLREPGKPLPYACHFRTHEQHPHAADCAYFREAHESTKKTPKTTIVGILSELPLEVRLPTDERPRRGDHRDRLVTASLISPDWRTTRPGNYIAESIGRVTQGLG